MDLHESFRQEAWVLQSASADHPPGPGSGAPPPPAAPSTPAAGRARSLLEEGWRHWQAGEQEQARPLFAAALSEAPSDLLLRRALNRICPSLNRHPLPDPRSRPQEGARVALVLPGQLRCLEASSPFLERLTEHGDLFICTEASYREAARSLHCVRPMELKILEEDPAALAEAAALAVGSMNQWHKLALCLRMVRQREHRSGRRYTHIVKLRSDFLHVTPERFFEDLLQPSWEGLATASDKVFAGPRDLMMLFEGFHRAIPGHFEGREDRYWPIDAVTILGSDESCKWYGLNWPERLVGRPTSVAALRRTLIEGGAELAKALARFQATPMERYVRLFKGHPRFASELCFVRFLLFCGIVWHENRALRGFLRLDRQGS